MKEKNKLSIFGTSFILSIFPVLSQYYIIETFFLSIGYFAILLLIILNIFVYKKEFRINRNIIYLFAFLSIYNYFISYSLNNSIGIALFGILLSLICTPNLPSIEKTYKTISFFGAIYTLFLVIQFISYYRFGIVLNGAFHFLKPIEDSFHSISYGRPSSVFYEPAHYVIFIAPIYLYALVKGYRLRIMLFAAGLILSLSTSGIAILIISLILVFLKNKSLKKKINNLFLIGISLIIISRLEIIAPYLEKIKYENLETNIRVFGGLEYLEYFKEKEVVFGIGLNKLADYGLNNGFIAENYTNSIIFAIISFGLIGLTLLIFSLINFLRKMKTNKEFLIILLLFLFTDQLLFNHLLFYLICWIYMLINIAGKSEDN